MKTYLSKILNLNFKIFITLLLLSCLADIAKIPYVISIAPNLSNQDTLLLLRETFINTLLISFPLIFFGVRLGSQVGLNIPIVKAIVSKDYRVQNYFRDNIFPSTLWGVIGGILIILGGYLFDIFYPISDMPLDLESPGFIPALLGSLGAGVGEEICYRLGTMTIIIWLGCKIIKGKEINHILFWIANILSAILFGVVHLPLVAAIGQLTIFTAAYSLLLNGIAGIIFGWLYWQRGLTAAIMAHFSTDIVIHVLPSIFT